MSSGAVCEALAVSMTTRIAAFADLTIKLSRAQQALRKASEKVGNELAKEWNAKRIGAGQCLLVQNSDPTADGHQLWCCRTVNCTEYKLRSADMGMDYGGCVLHVERKQE